MINATWLAFVDLWINKGHVYLAFIVDKRSLAFRREKKNDC